MCVCVCVCVCVHLNGLVEVDGGDFPHAVFDHLRSEEILLPFLLHCYLTVVFLRIGSQFINISLTAQGRRREGEMEGKRTKDREKRRRISGEKRKAGRRVKMERRKEEKTRKRTYSTLHYQLVSYMLAQQLLLFYEHNL